MLLPLSYRAPSLVSLFLVAAKIPSSAGGKEHTTSCIYIKLAGLMLLRSKLADVVPWPEAACQDGSHTPAGPRGHQDLNLGPLDLQSNALPLSYTPLCCGTLSGLGQCNFPYFFLRRGSLFAGQKLTFCKCRETVGWKSTRFACSSRLDFFQGVFKAARRKPFLISKGSVLV